MTDEEFNKELSTLITFTKAHMEISRPLSSVKEDMGQWDELLEDRESMKETCEGLFFDLEQGTTPLTPQNRLEIIQLKRTLYPLLLCDLYKCYERKGRFQDAEAVLLKAQSLDCLGAEVLLFSLYARHLDDMGKDRETAIPLLETAFRRVKKIDVFSEKIVEEINNEVFHAIALDILSDFYRIFDHDVGKSFDCLVKTLQLELPDNIRESIKVKLHHFRKDFRSGQFRYVE